MRASRTGNDRAALTDLRQERQRRIVASTMAAVAARLLSVLVSLISIPLAIGYLGTDRYGVLVALTSLSSMLVFADLGLGNGLLNLVSEANGRDDVALARRSISTAFFLLVVLATIFGFGLSVAFGYIPWAGILGVPPGPVTNEALPAAAVLISVALLSLPLAVSERVRLGYQEGFINSGWAALGALGSLVGLIAAVALTADLPTLIALIALPPVAALALNGARLFGVERPHLRPRFRSIDRGLLLRLARLGFLFFVLQLAVAIAFQSDILVAANVLGARAAAEYSVTMRVFMLGPSLISMALTTVWPAYGEAIARHDVAWVRRTLRRSLISAFFASSLASLVLLLVGPLLVGALTHGAIRPSLPLLIGMALWAVVNATFNTVAILFNASNVILFQVVVASAMAIGSIALSFGLAHVVGLPGVVWGTLIAYLALAGIPTLMYLPRLLRRLDAGDG